MNEIVQLLQEKAGLSQEQAQSVVQLLASHLQSRIPESMQGLVMPLLGVGAAGDGQTAESGGLSSLLGSVAGMFGNKS